MQRETKKLTMGESQILLAVLNDAVREYRTNANNCQALELTDSMTFWQGRITNAETLINMFITADEILVCKKTPEGL